MEREETSPKLQKEMRETTNTLAGILEKIMLRRTSASQWFDGPIIELTEHLSANVTLAFPEEHRRALNGVTQIVWATNSNTPATIEAAVYIHQLIEKMKDQVDIGEILSHGILDVRVNTIDSMQGGGAEMVIVDFALAKRRKGRYGFLTNRGRINVSVTRASTSRYSLGDPVVH